MDLPEQPFREALSRLVGEGLVTFESNKGFRVRGLSKEDLADIAYMRTAVETFATRTAIERGGMEWESGIVGSLHALVALTEDTATGSRGREADAWLGAGKLRPRVAQAEPHPSACGVARS